MRLYTAPSHLSKEADVDSGFVWIVFNLGCFDTGHSRTVLCFLVVLWDKWLEGTN